MCSATWDGLSHNTAADTDTASIAAIAAASITVFLVVLHVFMVCSFSMSWARSRSSASVRA